MQGPLIQAPIGDESTDVDPPRIRRVQLRAVRSSARDDERPVPTAAGCALGVRGDPGRTLGRASLAAVRMREAIVRRNHSIDTHRPQKPPAPELITVRIDWVRSGDAGLRIRLERPDTFRMKGRGAGRSIRPVPPMTPAIAIAIDGLIFTERVEPDDPPALIVGRLASRLEGQIELMILDSSGDSVTARLRSAIHRYGDGRGAGDAH